MGSIHSNRNIFSKGWKASLKPWLMAVRIKTLSLSMIPIITGTMLATDVVSQIDWTLMVFALLAAVLIQMGCNCINDALDFKKGADTAERIGFVRVSQAGLLTPKQVIQFGFFCFALAALFGIPLVVASGLPLLITLVLSILFGYLYTGGPYPLGYHGLGELFVLLFFGLVITCSAFYIQTGFLTLPSLLAGSQLGLLAAVPIAINNARDIQTDQKSGKWTLAARFGIQFARWEIIVLNAAAFLLGLGWWQMGRQAMAILPLITAPFSFYIIRGVWREEPNRRYNHYLLCSPLCQMLFFVLLGIGFFYY